MKPDWSRWLRWGLPLLLLLPFLLNVDAQWMRLDDFTMVVTMKADAKPLHELLSEIIFTRNTPHVRFAFLNHLVLLPLYRWAPESRALANFFFLAGPVVVVTVFGLLMKRAAQGAALAVAGWVTFAIALWQKDAWETFQFKLALYLVWGFALTALAALVVLRDAGADQTQPPARRLTWLWIAVSLAGIHMAEVTIGGMVVMGAVLVWHRRLPLWAFLLSVGWPLVWWGLNALLFPRAAVVLQHSTGPDVAAAWSFALRELSARWPLQLSLLVLWMAVAIYLQIRRRARRIPILTALSAAFFAQGAGIIVLTSLSYKWLGERHVAFANWSFAVALVFAAAQVTQEAGPRRLSVLPALGLILMGLTALPATVRTLGRTIDASRAELRGADLLTAIVQDAALASPSQPLHVFVRDWHKVSGPHSVPPTFLEADWSRRDYGRTYACPRSGPCPPIFFHLSGQAPAGDTELTSACEKLVEREVLSVSELHQPRLGQRLRFESPDHCAKFLRDGNYSLELPWS